jgi:hypothetical protein
LETTTCSAWALKTSPNARAASVLFMNYFLLGTSIAGRNWA